MLLAAFLNGSLGADLPRMRRHGKLLRTPAAMR
jgi:hypothetical protein